MSHLDRVYFGHTESNKAVKRTDLPNLRLNVTKAFLAVHIAYFMFRLEMFLKWCSGYTFWSFRCTLNYLQNVLGCVNTHL